MLVIFERCAKMDQQEGWEDVRYNGIARFFLCTLHIMSLHPWEYTQYRHGEGTLWRMNSLFMAKTPYNIRTIWPDHVITPVANQPYPLSQLMTILPATQHCWPDKPVGAGHWMVTSPWGVSHGCNDMIWSGHMVLILYGVFALNKEFIRQRVPSPIRYWLFLYAIGYGVTMVLTHHQYSVDIFIALIIAVLTFYSSSLRFFIWQTTNEVLQNPCKGPNWKPEIHTILENYLEEGIYEKDPRTPVKSHSSRSSISQSYE